MKTLDKWKLNLELNHEETCAVLEELFSGMNKIFNFNSKTKINHSLYELYQDFPETQSDVSLTFSEEKSRDLPFVSFREYESPTHTINTQCGILYIYDFV